jgi:predicted nucleic acid-binding Zn ribbon protein
MARERRTVQSGRRRIVTRKGGKDGKPEPIADALAGFLKSRGLDERVKRNAILFDWAELVGPQIAKVSTPRTIRENGELVVEVSTHTWMTELSLMETQLLARINQREGHAPIKRIRWELRR